MVSEEDLKCEDDMSFFDNVKKYTLALFCKWIKIDAIFWKTKTYFATVVFQALNFDSKAIFRPT